MYPYMWLKLSSGNPQLFCLPIVIVNNKLKVIKNVDYLYAGDSKLEIMILTASAVSCESETIIKYSECWFARLITNVTAEENLPRDKWFSLYCMTNRLQQNWLAAV